MKIKIGYLIILSGIIFIACPPIHYTVEMNGKIIGYSDKQKYGIKIYGLFGNFINYKYFNINENGNYQLKLYSDLYIKGVALYQNDTIVSILMCEPQFLVTHEITEMISGSKYLFSAENHKLIGSKINFTINNNDSNYYDLNLDKISAKPKYNDIERILTINVGYYKSGYSLGIIHESFDLSYYKKYPQTPLNSDSTNIFRVEEIPNSEFIIIIANQYGWTYTRKFNPN